MNYFNSVFMKQITFILGLLFLSIMAYSQSYQAETNSVLEKYTNYYSDLFIAKGPTEIIINDSSYSIAGSVSNGNLVVSISWKGQKIPSGTSSVYSFLQYDTTTLPLQSFASKLFDDIAAQFGLTGVQNISKGLGNKIFPNPSDGKCTLKVPCENCKYSTFIFNNLGVCVDKKEGVVVAGEIHLNLSALPNGSYLIEVFTGSKKYIFREILNGTDFAVSK